MNSQRQQKLSVTGEIKRGRPPSDGSAPKKQKTEPSEPLIPIADEIVKKGDELDKFFANEMEALKKARTDSARFFRDILKRQKGIEKKLSIFQKRKEEKKERREAKKTIVVVA